MNVNYEETEEGFWKKDKSKTKGQSPYGKPIPPVRDTLTGYPIRNGQVDYPRDANGKIDYQKVLEDCARQRGK
jgi:hypothetical protein